MAKAGEVRIIGVTSAERIDAAPDAPTLKEQGYDAEFVNWRGFFAAPGLPADKAEAYRKAIAKMYDTPEWSRAGAQWLGEHPQYRRQVHKLPGTAGRGDQGSDEEAGLPVSR